jgi:peptide/nickel transport system substrate-binding protein
VRRQLAVLFTGALGVALAAAGCTSVKQTQGGTGPTAPVQQGFVSNNPDDSKGPAAPVPGATRGGTLNVLEPSDFDFLDPAREYVNIDQITGTILTRSLTTYKETPQPDGSVRMLVVGDTATDAGTDVNHDCKVWKYTLKDGLKYEDGTPVTAADVAYGIARSYSTDLVEGAHYIQNWLAGTGSTSADYNKDYKGPYNGGADVPPGMTVSGNTMTFTFSQPHCDMPYAAAMPMTAAVPKAKDTRGDYTRHPLSDGPYMISSHITDTSLTLVRNPYWDPKTDAVHHAYPDQIKMVLDVNQNAINQRLVADQGDDQTAITWSNVTAEAAAQVTGEVTKRVVDGATQFADFIAINNQRVTDVNVRKALNTGLDKTAALKAIGGDTAGTVLNTLESPTTPAWQDYNVFGVGPTGDPAKAKQLLGGKTPELTLCFASGVARREAQALAIQASLQQAGFKIDLKPIGAANYYTLIGSKNIACDLYRAGWGSDWPSGSTIIPPLFDGRSIQASGNTDYAYYNSDATNAEIDRISGETDSTQAAKDWAALDKKIMETDAPVIPIVDDRNYTLIGSKVGGAFLSMAFGATSLNNIYIKS